jgi:hypothetical protein
MLAWLAALVAGAAFAYGQYRLAGLPNAWRLQALRGGAVAAIVALLLNAPIGWRSAPRAYAALDASASWRSAGDSAAWAKAVQAAARAGADTTLLFGDSVRAGKPPAMPGDVGSHVTPLVERALGLAAPLWWSPTVGSTTLNGWKTCRAARPCSSWT